MSVFALVNSHSLLFAAMLSDHTYACIVCALNAFLSPRLYVSWRNIQLQSGQSGGKRHMRDEYLILSFTFHFNSCHVIGACCLSGNSPSGALDFKAVLNTPPHPTKKVSQITMAQDDFFFPHCHCRFTDSLNLKAQQHRI